MSVTLITVKLQPAFEPRPQVFNHIYFLPRLKTRFKSVLNLRNRQYFLNFLHAALCKIFGDSIYLFAS